MTLPGKPEWAKMLHLTLPYPSPSGNQTKRWVFAGQTWRLSSARSEVSTLARSEWRRLGRPGVECAQWFVSYLRCGRQLLDADNLVAGLKHIQDGLIAAGVVADDNPRCFEASHEQVVSRNPKDWRTVIEVWGRINAH